MVHPGHVCSLDHFLLIHPKYDLLQELDMLPFQRFPWNLRLPILASQCQSRYPPPGVLQQCNDRVNSDSDRIGLCMPGPLGVHILAEFPVPYAPMLRGRNILLCSTAVTPEIQGSTWTRYFLRLPYLSLRLL